jgi:hypothetical protein
VGLDVPAFFADSLLELTLGRIEGVAERNVDVLVMLPVGDDLGMPRHADIDANLELSAVLMVLAGLGDGDPAARNARMEVFEAGNLFPDAGVQGSGMGHVANRDLQRDLHCASREGGGEKIEALV